MAVLTKITQRSLADNAVTSAHVQGDVIAAGDIADDAVGTAELANDLSISTSGNIATTGSGTLAVAGTSALTGNVTAAGTLGVTGASTLTGATTVGGTLGVTGAATASGGLSVVGATALTSIKQTDAQNLSGTYTTHELIMGKTFTLNGNLTVNENLILGSMSGAGTNITIQPDSTHRTITSTGGTGILEGGEVLGSRPELASVTGMTGELGSAITGTPAITGLGTVKSGNIDAISAVVYMGMNEHSTTTGVARYEFKHGVAAINGTPDFSPEFAFHLFVIEKFWPVTDGGQMRCRVSCDLGDNYVTSNYDGWSQHGAASPATTLNATDSYRMSTTVRGGGNDTEGYNGHGWLHGAYRLNSSLFNFAGMAQDSASNIDFYNGIYRNGTKWQGADQPINAVSFHFHSGNIKSGRVRMWGFRGGYLNA